MVQPPKSPAHHAAPLPTTHLPTPRVSAAPGPASSGAKSTSSPAKTLAQANDPVAPPPPADIAAFAAQFERRASVGASHSEPLTFAGARRLPTSETGQEATLRPALQLPATEVKAPTRVLVESKLAELQNMLREIQEEPMVRKDSTITNARTLGAKSLLRKAQNEPWRSPIERKILTGAGLAVKGVAVASWAVGLPYFVARGMTATKERRGGVQGDTSRRAVEMKRKRLYEVQRESVSQLENLLFSLVFDERAGRLVDTLHEDFRYDDEAIRNVSQMLNRLHQTVMAMATDWGLDTAWTPAERELLPTLIDRLGTTAILDQKPPPPPPEQLRQAVLDAAEQDDPKRLFACLQVVNGQILRDLRLDGRPLIEAIALKAASSKNVPQKLLNALFNLGVRAHRGAVDAAIDSGKPRLFDVFIAHKGDEPAASVEALARALERGDLTLAKKVRPHVDLPSTHEEYASLVNAALRASGSEVFDFVVPMAPSGDSLAQVAVDVVRSGRPEHLKTVISHMLGKYSSEWTPQVLGQAAEVAFEMQRFDHLAALLAANVQLPAAGLDIIRAARQAGPNLLGGRTLFTLIVTCALDDETKDALLSDGLASPSSELLLLLANTGRLPYPLNEAQAQAFLDRGDWTLVEEAGVSRYPATVEVLEPLLELARSNGALTAVKAKFASVHPSSEVRSQLVERALASGKDEVFDFWVEHDKQQPLEPRILLQLENDAVRAQKVAPYVEATSELLSGLVERGRLDLASAVRISSAMPEPLLRSVLDLGHPELAARMAKKSNLSAGLKRRVIEEGHLSHFAAVVDRLGDFVSDAYGDDTGLSRIQQIVSQEPFEVLQRIVNTVSAAGGEALVEQFVNLPGVREAAQNRQLTDQKDVVVFLRQMGQRGTLPEDKKKKG